MAQLTVASWFYCLTWVIWPCGLLLTNWIPCCLWRRFMLLSWSFPGSLSLLLTRCWQSTFVVALWDPFSGAPVLPTALNIASSSAFPDCLLDPPLAANLSFWGMTLQSCHWHMFMTGFIRYWSVPFGSFECRSGARLGLCLSVA
jgi:hypothetical protein